MGNAKFMPSSRGQTAVRLVEKARPEIETCRDLDASARYVDLQLRVYRAMRRDRPDWQGSGAGPRACYLRASLGNQAPDAISSVMRLEGFVEVAKETGSRW